MRIANIEQVKEQVRRFLPAFLTSRGVQVSNQGWFSCPAHRETEASAHFLPESDRQRWWCLGCESGGDIFDMAHYTDGLPKSGPGWFNQTLKKLADEFHIELKTEDRDLTPEELREAEIYRAYEKAAAIVLSMKRSEAVEAKLVEYGWSKKTQRVFGIGGVSSYQKFVNTLVKAGFAKTFLEEIGLANNEKEKDYTASKIFRPECLIFTVKDRTGRPIAFSSRYLFYEQDEAAMKEATRQGNTEEFDRIKKGFQPKYVNTGSRNEIYRKKEVLFGLHAAAGTSKLIYIFEGNADAVTAYDQGLINSAALCGSAFTIQHFTQIVEAGFDHVIFAMDGDAGGREASRRIIVMCDKFLADKPRVRASLIQLKSADGSKIDPDELIRKQGLGALQILERHGFRYWQWKEEFAANRDRYGLVHDALPAVLKVESAPLRLELLDDLSSVTGIGLPFLWEGLLQLAEQGNTKACQEVKDTTRWLRAIQDGLPEARRAMEEPDQAPPAEIPTDYEEEEGIPASMLVPICEVEQPKVSRQAKAEAAAKDW